MIPFPGHTRPRPTRYRPFRSGPRPWTLRCWTSISDAWTPALRSRGVPFVSSDRAANDPEFKIALRVGELQMLNRDLWIAVAAMAACPVATDIW